MAWIFDGVIFDFNTHFVSLARNRHHELVCPNVGPEWPTKWDYLDDYLEQWQLKSMWRYICHQSPTFWRYCPQYPWSTELINVAHSNADMLYFITSRQGPMVQYQTVMALKDVAPHDDHYGGVIPTPNAEAKIPIIKALNLSHYVDDKIETVQAVHQQCPTVSVAVWDQPWNREATWLPNRLKTVADFTNWISRSKKHDIL